MIARKETLHPIPSNPCCQIRPVTNTIPQLHLPRKGILHPHNRGAVSIFSWHCHT